MHPANGTNTTPTTAPDTAPPRVLRAGRRRRWVLGPRRHGGHGAANGINLGIARAGGNACAIRSGGDLAVRAGAVLSARGGAGALVNGRVNGTGNNTDWGVASPGGGGSGGPFLLQSATDVAIAGAIDTSGEPAAAPATSRLPRST